MESSAGAEALLLPMYTSAQLRHAAERRWPQAVSPAVPKNRQTPRHTTAFPPPFRNKGECITKEDPDIGRQHISIKYNDGLDFEWIRLPDFKLDTMYVGMQPNKEYTLKELGL